MQMKKKIKQVAINLFYKKGYFATSMSNIALGSGIQKASIYHHYANKEEILVDIFKSTLQDLLDSFEATITKYPDPQERFRAVICNHIIFHVDRQKEAIIADSELRGLTVDNYKTVLRMRDRYEHRFQQVLEQCVQSGGFAAADCNVLSYGILTMCTAVCSWFNPAGRLSKEEIAHVYADFIVAGMKSRSERKGA